MNIKYIFNEYVLAKMKEKRVFNGVTKDMTSTNNIDLFIYDYIMDNVYSRYSNITIDLFVKFNTYNDVVNKNNMVYNSDIMLSDNLYTKYKISRRDDYIDVTLPIGNISNFYGLYYYFNISYNI